MSWWIGFFKKTLKKRAAPLIILAAFFIFGFLLMFYSWDGKFYVSLGEGKYSRGLAEENKSNPSVMALSKENLEQKGSHQLFAKTKSDRVGPLLEFFLGNFMIPDETQGKFIFICQFYNYVELTFQGQDSIVNGKNTGGMVFKAPCLTKEEGFIGPFYFPLSDVLIETNKDFLQQPQQKMEFALTEKDTRVRFFNMAPAMNDNWLLVIARFFNSSDPDEDGFTVTFKSGEDAPYFELHFQQSL